MRNLRHTFLYTFAAFLLLTFCRPLVAQNMADTHSFSTASLNGSYAFHSLAWFVDTTVKPPQSAPFAFSGFWNFDGKGNLTATDTLNDPTGSGVVPNRRYSGTYTVNRDGTGAIEVSLGGGITVPYTLAIAANGNLIEVVTERPNIVSTFTLEKQ